jgi:outer membrane lipopolysaccharide assembly protein LptE/RlpB
MLNWISYRLLISMVVVSALATGCGYQLTRATTQTLRADQKLWVQLISNESVSPTAQTVLRRALYDEFHALRGLAPSDSEQDADLIMKGRVVSYSRTALSYSALDRAREFRLTVEVELELYKKEQATPFWKGLLQASTEYPANVNLSLQHNAEESALDTVARIIAHKMISATEQSY